MQFNFKKYEYLKLWRNLSTLCCFRNKNVDLNFFDRTKKNIHTRTHYHMIMMDHYKYSSLKKETNKRVLSDYDINIHNNLIHFFTHLSLPNHHLSVLIRNIRHHFLSYLNPCE